MSSSAGKCGWTIGAVLLLLSAGAGLSQVRGGKSVQGTRSVDFTRDIRPILEARCWGCHGPDEQKAGLRLDSRPAFLKGGASGPALVPGRSAESEIVRRITAREATRLMPPGRPLAPEEIARIRAWIDAGAPLRGVPGPKSRVPSQSGAREDSGPGTRDSGPAKPHWAFRPVSKPAVPTIRDPQTRKGHPIRNPIDAFVLHRLQGGTLAPEADRPTLLRRVTFDLTGVPPTPEELSAFVDDRAPDAYEKVVRRLLASPRYGERQAQHWLDVVRFAETNGFELDGDRPQAWRYRDWVVRALNEDMPYDRFLQLQIAGDELAPGDFDAAVATGFLRAGPEHVVGGNQEPAVVRQEWLTEAVSGVGNAVLGLTVQCARCHDHKYDPVPQADYYRLQAFFAGTANKDYPRAAPEEKAAHEAAVREHRERLAPIKAKLAALEHPYRERLRQAKLAKLEPHYRAALDLPAEKRTPEQARLAREAGVMLNLEWTEVVAALTPEDRDRRAAVRAEMHALENDAPPPLPAAAAVGEVFSPVPPVHVLVRGEPHALGSKVEPGFPSALALPAAPEPAACEGEGPEPGRRTRLARWLTRPDHPLTARVMVNRVWQVHFGQGLVTTPNDFGKNGAKPVNPELLDYLAAWFVSGGEGREERREGAWSLKRLHRFIVTSATYRQSRVPNSANAQRAPDPQSAIRLDAEALRDAILHAAGTLNEERGGPSVRVPLEPEVYATIFTEGEPDNLWPVTKDPAQHTRRSLYLYRKRNVRLPMFAVFDAPDMMTSCAARLRSVHALQSLTLMNSDFMTAQSRAFAARILREGRVHSGRPGGRGQEERIRRLHLLALGREPTAKESEATGRFLREQTAIIRERFARGERVARIEGLTPGIDPAEAAAWADLCLATFNRNDFVYLQ